MRPSWLVADVVAALGCGARNQHRFSRALAVTINRNGNASLRAPVLSRRLGPSVRRSPAQKPLVPPARGS